MMVLVWVALLASDGMVQVPAGEFTMGRTKSTRDDSTKMRPQVLLDDRPAHKVWVDAFEMDAREVTNARYAKFVAATGRKTPYHWVGGKVPEGQESYPIYNVDWADADAFCKWDGKRLPTEAEWERAARGGLEGMDYPWGDGIKSAQALFNVQTGPGPVGQFAPNAFGLFDMAGGVSEWCSDWWDHDYYGRGENKSPKGPAQGLYKIMRGGAWSDSPKRVTVFFRNWAAPEQKTPNVGFRCAANAR